MGKQNEKLLKNIQRYEQKEKAQMYGYEAAHDEVRAD